MMKSKRASALVAVLAVSSLSIGLARAAQASDDACKDHSARIAELERKVAEIENRLDQVPPSSPGVTLGSIVRNADGSVRRMTQNEAVSYCATRGGLPTAKQLALALNAKGVSDTARDGFYQVAPKNETPFYYKNYAYERPTGDEGREWFWSSSLHPYDADFAFVFYGGNGSFGSDGRNNFNAVRCAGR